MRRRAFLASGLAAMTATAGCVHDGSAGTDDGEDELLRVQTLGSTPDPDVAETGLPSETEDVDTPSVDVESLDTLEVDGVAVPLLPIDEVYDWHRAGEARFVDARDEPSYEDVHVAGAVLSPIRGGYGEDDPTREWDESERVVTYCSCPHHLSSQRASELMQAGHEAVFAIDEGFGPWVERDYPTESGGGTQELSATLTVTGRVDPVHAGESVFVHHEPGDQYYSGRVDEDGTYEMSFHLYDAEPDDTLAVETPEGTRRGTVAELTDGSLH